MRLSLLSLPFAFLGFLSLNTFAKDGDDIVNLPARDWGAKSWIQTGRPLDFASLKGEVLLVRFWTDQCPWCKSTAPALEEFHEKYKDRGLVVVGMYTPKPPREVKPEEAAEFAKKFGIRFPVALDNDWATLKAWWLEPGGRQIKRNYTSVSFLIDRQGMIRKIHPGPEFFPSDDPEHAKPNRDYLDMKAAVEKLLDEPAPPPAVAVDPPPAEKPAPKSPEPATPDPPK